MRRVLKFAAISLLLAALIVVYLMRFHGLRIERDGSGLWVMFSFYKPEQHMAAISQNRVAAAAEPAPVKPAEAIPTSSKPEPIAKPYWTDFRGPLRDGNYREMPISFQWPAEGPRRIWRKPIGAGYASFVFGNGLVFTIEQREEKEVVAAYSLKDGRQVWSHASNAHFQESMGGDGPRATPTWHDGRLYALGAEGELKCLDAEEGRLLWSRNILTDNGAQNLQWGMSAAPLVVDNTLIVLPGSTANKSVAAYDRLTGEPVWQALSDKQSYTSPMVAMLAGERQILIVSASRAVGLTPKGELLWEYPWSTSYDINASQPLITGPDTFFLSAGYGHGAALVRVAKSDGRLSASTVWQNTRMKNKFTSSVLHEGHVYGLDEAILACVNAETGELKWKGGRYGYGQLVLASGHLIVAAEDGDVALVRAVPSQHEELVRFPAIEGKTWNHPAISGGVLLVRNGTEMAAFSLAQL